MTFELADIALRIAAAGAVGALLGLNRDLKGKPTGVRTLGLVGIASAATVIPAYDLGGDGLSRVIQGLITGIGFLGAGVILRRAEKDEVSGLTTAACAWLTACLGVVCGMGAWPVVMISIPLVFLVLLFGGRFENLMRDLLHKSDES